MKILSTVRENLHAQSWQEKFYYRLAARLYYQRLHKVTSITKSLSFHIYFTVHVLYFDFLHISYFKIHNLLHVIQQV